MSETPHSAAATVASWRAAAERGDVNAAVGCLSRDVVLSSPLTEQFRLEPLGPQHNESDHAAWTSSIEHIRATPGYPDGRWPPADGMTLEENLADLRRHAGDFTRGVGFTFTVLDPDDNDVIGCVYIYPSRAERQRVGQSSLLGETPLPRGVGRGR